MNRYIQKNKERNRRNFNNKAEHYFETWDGKYSLLMYGEVIKIINMYSYYSILDVGCGPGVMLARIMNQRGDVNACGIDISDKMIMKANELLKNRAELIAGDADRLPWDDNAFDVLVCNASFHHYPEPYKVLQEMKRVLKPTGRLIIADPWWPGIIRYFINLYLKTPFNIDGDYKIYSEKEIMKLLNECGFKIGNYVNPIGNYYVITAVIGNKNGK